MLEQDVIDRIRHIFLHQRPHVSISQATALFGWTRAEMTKAITTGEIVLMETPIGKWVRREELVAKALELWPRESIEEALGTEADTVLPHAVRLVDLRTRIPRYQRAMLEYFAVRHETTVSDVLTRELEGVASAHSEELSVAIPGFAAAFAWPEGDTAQLPC
jgi:hypothetical protein